MNLLYANVCIPVCIPFAYLEHMMKCCSTSTVLMPSNALFVLFNHYFFIFKTLPTYLAASKWKYYNYELCETANASKNIVFNFFVNVANQGIILIEVFFLGCVSKSKSSGSNTDCDVDRKRASSRGIIPRAKIKTVKMTLVIVFGKLKIQFEKFN